MRRIAEMLRCALDRAIQGPAQHDRIEFFHTFSGFPASPAPFVLLPSDNYKN
jgi:hypothetical protein